MVAARYKNPALKDIDRQNIGFLAVNCCLPAGEIAISND
jgi:hypothetical protein